MKNNPGRPDQERMDILQNALILLKRDLLSQGWEFVASYYFAYDKEFNAAQDRASRLKADENIEYQFFQILPDSQHYAIFLRRKNQQPLAP